VSAECTATLPRFGLSLSSWKALDDHLDSLGDEAKVIYVVRHAEGTHNVAEREYGTAAWNAKYSFEPKYTDAPLSDEGARQSQALGRMITHEMSDGWEYQTLVSSPMRRTLNTSAIAFDGLHGPRIVLEDCREGISLHTCDHRSNISDLARQFSLYDFSNVAHDVDPYWGTMDETSQQEEARAQRFLTTLWACCTGRHVVVTTHSGFGAALFRLLKHPKCGLPNAALHPIVVVPTNSQARIECVRFVS